ncbi:MAG: DUF1579 domain-containing protein [Candidatus Krumholzibacteriia bacterium]
MRHRNQHLIALLALATLVGLSGASSSRAEDQPMSEADMMKIYMAAAAPGPEHAMLAGSAGTWSVKLSSWMDPTAEPTVTEGSETARMILGGRFLQSDFQGTGMMGPFEGMGLIGYDNVKKKYVGTWSDTMGTGLMSYEGDYDAPTRTLVCHGDFVDAATGMTMTTRLVTRTISDDEHVFEMFGPGPGGDEVKWMEMRYTRVK